MTHSQNPLSRDWGIPHEGENYIKEEEVSFCAFFLLHRIMIMKYAIFEMFMAMNVQIVPSVSRMVLCKLSERPR